VTFPLPARLARLFESAPPTASPSLSLVLARGVGTWKEPFSTRPELDKGAFLAEFRNRFAEPPDYEPWLERRKGWLEEMGAKTLSHVTESRLVIGLGLPHPTDTGFLLDRLTGCPYLPGSTVKGLLRAAAREVVLEKEWEPPAGDRDFWEENLERVFGPPASAEGAARGSCVFYDAFPERWPALEVDVLTPHYGPYYAQGEEPVYPGDWEPPVPVPFLTVAAGTRFCFPVRPLLPPLERLLGVALSWLGIGGKTRAGYGFFAEPVGRGGGEGPAGEQRWEKAYVHLIRGPGVVEAVLGTEKATAPLKVIEEMAPELAASWGRPKRRTVLVRARDEGGLAIVGVEN
jgi:CRISPR type III-B/RAMP module RAMP protein Cmr6